MAAVAFAPRSIAGAIAPLQVGRDDPTTVLGRDELWRATLTPDGPGTLHLRWGSGALDAEAFGPGADWLLARVPALTGALDRPHRFDAAHPAVMAAQRDQPHLRLGRSETPYHELLPTVIGQRITGAEATRQWHRLCERLGACAPGPHPGLRLPPEPAMLVGRPAWWFHPLGIEARRANTLRAVARHAHHLWHLDPSQPAAAVDWLTRLPGIGPWTANLVAANALGDPDAVPVGDYHLPNVVAYALAGEARADDARMLELLTPYAGQRGRVVRLLTGHGWRAPVWGPRQRILPMHRW
jgi:3-methyladenine DNA glycosylase/8-oxoguanine DNA glycosylase